MTKIGLAACFMYQDPQRAVFGKKNLSYAENDMLAYLAGKGALPLLIPDLDWEIQKRYLQEVDALVLQGGTDIAPETYGEFPSQNGRWPGDKHRDEYERKLLDYAVAEQIPVLGICRGMQMINVYFGGSLYQDLESEFSAQVVHRDAQKYDTVHHQVNLLENEFLAEIYEAKTLEVNSVHHQGIKSLGADLVICARSAEDGLIEAIRHKQLPIWGVQWHPEFNHTLRESIPPGEPIIDKFLSMLKEMNS